MPASQTINMPIGIFDLAMGGWSAGGNYSEVLARGLSSAAADVIWLSDREQPGLKRRPLDSTQYFPGEWTLRRLVGSPRKSRLTNCTKGLAVVGPLLHAESAIRGKNVGWIPDFQPLLLTELYPREEIRKARRQFENLLQRCDCVLVSSHDSERVAGELFPQFRQKLRVLSFPSLFCFASPRGDAEKVREKYRLPESYLLVANQFWKHKNHIQIVEALVVLAAEGLEIPCVMTGLPADFRDRNNEVLSELFQAIARHGLSHQVVILGLVPRQDLEGLIRGSTAIVQPSRFEGWNTTVEDGKALGAPLLLSDIPVHREQAPTADGFFPLDHPRETARVLARFWDSRKGEGLLGREENALRMARSEAERFGCKAREIFEQA